jgi:hypothetical protein
VEKYSTVGQATDDKMAQVLSMLDKRVYKHKRRICNTYCFSTVTMVMRTLPQRYVIASLVGLSIGRVREKTRKIKDK